MAMEDEGQAKEIPLATAQPVHAQLGSWWYRHPRGGDLSRSRKDSVPSSPRSSADQQPDASREASGCWSADERGEDGTESLRDLDRSPPRGCRYHQDPSWACTGCAVASGISFACPSSSMAIVQKLLPIRRTDFSPQIRGHSNSLVLSPYYYSLL